MNTNELLNYILDNKLDKDIFAAMFKNKYGFLPCQTIFKIKKRANKLHLEATTNVTFKTTVEYSSSYDEVFKTTNEINTLGFIVLHNESQKLIYTIPEDKNVVYETLFLEFLEATKSKSIDDINALISYLNK